MNHRERFRKKYIALSVTSAAAFFRTLFIIASAAVGTLHSQTPSGDEILRTIDRLMFSETKFIMSKMVIHGRRESRTVEAQTWQRGTSETFTEYLAPAREKGTKMLKLNDRLWTYSPSTDRTIMIARHMLRQSVMGSDLSYEDMMEDPRLTNLYRAEIFGEENVLDRPCWVLHLSAIKEDIAYHSRKVWVDKTRFLILREHLFAKSGKLLKTVEVNQVKKMKDRWIASAATYKDVLKEGKGTEFFIDSLRFDLPIPDHVFTKASLR